MIAMVGHAQALPDQIRDPLRRPEVRPVSLSQRSLEEEAHQLLFLDRGQPGWPAWRRLGVERVCSTRLPGIAPSKNAAGMATHAARDLMQREVLFEEGDHFSPSGFQCFGRTVWSHGGSPLGSASSILH